jgi:hypothetical protein
LLRVSKTFGHEKAAFAGFFETRREPAVARSNCKAQALVLTIAVKTAVQP